MSISHRRDKPFIMAVIACYTQECNLSLSRIRLHFDHHLRPVALLYLNTFLDCDYIIM